MDRANVVDASRSKSEFAAINKLLLVVVGQRS
jgi:hypothetical protein